MNEVAPAVRIETVAYLTGRREIMAVMADTDADDDADDDLDSLYRVPPAEFTALRAELVKAAKQRGDTASAKQIGAARRPTAAAWIVNRLVLGDQEARQRLTDLSDRLRAAHAAMDGDRIRDLSAEQHRLVRGLVRAALNAAEVTSPSSALRDDISSTLQAAIADPEVRQRLGRLAKAERWSGFGDFGDAAPVSTPARTKQTATQAKPPPTPPKTDAQRDKAAEAARREREKLEAAVAEARNTKAETDDALSERQGERDEARLRRDEALDVLRDAEADLRTAENRYERAQQADRRAAEAVREAQAKLKRA